MRALWLADVLRDAGLTIRPYPGWEVRGADSFDPRGVILHHTVTPPSSPDSAIDKFLASGGNITTPPPLCNYSTNRDGSVSLIASGTANHGGTGNWKGVAGNRFFFGDEMKNYGTPSREPWVPRQLDSARIAAAAVLTEIGRDASWVCGHKEYALPPGRKTDPHSLNMSTERALIAAIMTPEENNMLPLDPNSAVEDIRSLQNRLNLVYSSGLALDGVWGESTIAAVKTNLGSLTGDPTAAAGKRVVARQWDQLLLDLITKHGGGAGGLQRGDTVKLT